MPRLEVNGIEVAYRDTGRGQAVVLAHSSSSFSGQWRALIERLGDRYRVIAPDLIGYGGTGAWPPGRDDLMADEIAIVEAMVALGGAPAHLVGHSYGGAICVRAALRRPERTRSLTVIEPVMFHLLSEPGDTAARAEIREVAEDVARCVEAGRPDAAAEGFLGYWIGPGAYAALAPDRRDLVRGSMAKLALEWPYCIDRGGPTRTDVAGLTTPTLVVRGGETTRAAASVVDILRACLPDHAYAEIAGAAGHMSPITHAEAVNSHIEAHIAKHS